MRMWPNHALQRTAVSRRGCNPASSCAGSLSLVCYCSFDRNDTVLGNKEQCITLQKCWLFSSGQMHCCIVPGSAAEDTAGGEVVHDRWCPVLPPQPRQVVGGGASRPRCLRPGCPPPPGRVAPARPHAGLLAGLHRSGRHRHLGAGAVPQGAQPDRRRRRLGAGQPDVLSVGVSAGPCASRPVGDVSPARGGRVGPRGAVGVGVVAVRGSVGAGRCVQRRGRTRRCSRRRGMIGFWDFIAHRCPAAAELGRSASINEG